MNIITKELEFKTRGNNDILDITPRLSDEIRLSNFNEGFVNLMVIGSTAALTTMEYEPGLKKDIPEALEKIAPSRADYEHHKTWGDYNGSAHVRSAIIGPDLTIPFKEGKLMIGTWQQIALMDFDTRPRERRIAVQMIGE